jgi:hypothetical protein
MVLFCRVLRFLLPIPYPQTKPSLTHFLKRIGKEFPIKTLKKRLADERNMNLVTGYFFRAPSSQSPIKAPTIKIITKIIIVINTPNTPRKPTPILVLPGARYIETSTKIIPRTIPIIALFLRMPVRSSFPW